MERTPIVLIHQGDSNYLFRTLFMLNRFYKKNEIFLIGNAENKHYSNWCTHVSIDKLLIATNQIASSFFNLSSNSAGFELFCIQRWFVLSAFINNRGLKQVIYLDSDILIYEQLDKYFPFFNGYGMTMIGVSGHTNFIQNPKVLTNFCDWILNLYSTDSGKATIQQWYSEHLTVHKDGGISDMTFFTKYLELCPTDVLNLENFSSEFVFDRSFSESNGFETEDNGMKKLIWKNNTPFVKQLQTGVEKRMVTIHFQGIGKPYLLSSLRPKSLKFQLADTYFQSRIFIMKVISKLKKSV